MLQMYTSSIHGEKQTDRKRHSQRDRQELSSHPKSVVTFEQYVDPSSNGIKPCTCVYRDVTPDKDLQIFTIPLCATMCLHGRLCAA